MKRAALVLASCALPALVEAQPAPHIPIPEGTKVLKDLATSPAPRRQKLTSSCRRRRAGRVVAIHGGAFLMTAAGWRFVARGPPSPPSTTG
jgi:hypothetical protein